MPLPDGPRESCAPTEPVVVATSSDRRTLKLLDGAGGFRQWESLEESQTFARTFSKALIEAIVRGEGAVAVWIDGQVVLHTRRS